MGKEKGMERVLGWKDVESLSSKKRKEGRGGDSHSSPHRDRHPQQQLSVQLSVLFLAAHTTPPVVFPETASPQKTPSQIIRCLPEETCSSGKKILVRVVEMCVPVYVQYISRR